jgi:hypothetical protein
VSSNLRNNCSRNTQSLRVTWTVQDSLMSNGVPCTSVGGETRVACPTRSPLGVLGLASCLWGCPSMSPARTPTTVSTPFPGVKIRVSLYPASLRRSSRRSYVFDVPRRCSGMLRLSLARPEGYLDLPQAKCGASVERPLRRRMIEGGSVARRKGWGAKESSASRR